MVGVNIEYFKTAVLRYDHNDFMKAMKQDLGIILGSLGLWAIKCHIDLCKERGDNENKKQYQTMHDLIEKYIETKFELLGLEKKYNFLNKYGPKKCPDM